MECEPSIDLRPTRHSVLKVDRQLTDKFIRVIFGISFLLWLVVVVYGFIVPVKSVSVSSNFYFGSLGITRILVVIGIVLTSAILTLIIFVALRWIPHMTKITLVIFLILMLYSIAYAYREAPVMISVVLAMLTIATCIFISNLLSTEWFHVPETILKEACKMIISVPSTAVFALLTCLLNVFLIAIVGMVISKLINGELSNSLRITLSLFNLLFGTWTIITVFALAFMTLSGTFAEYYWNENKSSVSLGTVWRLLTINLRYHLGTAAMYHPWLGGLGALCQITGECTFLFFMYNFIFDMIVLRIAMLGAGVMSSVKGENFWSSLGNTMNIFMNNPRRFLTVVKLMDLVLLWSGGIGIILTGLSTYYYVRGTYSPNDDKWQLLFIILAVLGASVPVGTFFICLAAAYFSITLCFEEELLHSRHTVPLESCAMSTNLHAALNRDGPPNWFRKCCRCCAAGDLMKTSWSVK